MGGVQSRTYFVAKHLEKHHHIEILQLSEGRIEASAGSIPRRLQFGVGTVLARPSRKPDLIEASNVTTYLPAFLLAKRLRVPVIAWVPDVLGDDWLRYFPPLVALSGKILETIAFRLPWNHLIAMSKSTKEKLSHQGVDSQKITVVYGGVEYHKLRGLAVTKFPTPTICSIARLLPYKRLEDLIEATRIVKGEIPQIRCLIIGEGPEERSLKVHISSLKLDSSVKLRGNLPHQNAMEILKRSHIFCLPSVVEGFGLVTVEAMAAGVPYVNARIAPTVEVTGNGKGGLLFEPNNPDDLAEKILTLLADGELYRSKQKEGQKLAKRYDWAIIARQTEEVYLKTMEKTIKI